MSRIALYLLASIIAIGLSISLPAGSAPLPHFTPPTAIWNTDARPLATKPNSALMMTHLAAFSSSGWGDTRNFDFQIDLSFYVLHANAATPTRPIVAFPSGGDYYSPDCDAPGSLFPVPATGGIEGTDPPSYACNTDDSDCHLLVANDTTKVLYESYFTDSANASGVHSICGLRWDLAKTYPRYGRGEHCTSADGAGFPIAPLLFNADEVWAAAQTSGDLGHAIRFILGNNRMTYRKYVHPSSHGTKATSDTAPNSVPYGSRLRLKSSFDIDAFSTNASVRVILRTLQKYGMFLSDGGGVPLTGESDAFTTHKWADADVDLDTHSLFGIRPTDFDVIESGDMLSVVNASDGYNDCVRTPDDFIYIDGFDY